MKTNYLLLRSVLCIAFFSLTISASGADFYWKSNAVDNIFTNPANWTDVTGTFTPTGSDGQLRPWSGDNVFFTQATSTFTTINCTGGKCLNVNLPNAGSAEYTFNNELNVFGSINSPVSRLSLAFGSKIVFDGSGAKTIQLTNGFPASNNYITFEFRGNGSYSLVNNLISFGTSGSFTLHDNVQVITAGYDLSLNFIKFIAPAVSASMNLDNSNVKLYEGIFYGEWNNTLPPGPGVSISAVNSTLELCVIYNNSGAQSITGMERILFRPGTYYPVVSSSGTTIQSDTIYVDANTFGAYSDLTCDYFELLRPTSINGVISGAIRFNDFIVPLACTGTSSLNFAAPVSSYTFQNTSGVSKTIEMLFKNVSFAGSNVNSDITNNQGGNTGNISWTPTPPGAGLSFYWVGGAGDWNDPTQWSIISSGGTAQLANGCIPTLLDDVYFDVNSFTAVGQNVTNVGLTPLFSKNVYWTDPANEAGIFNGFYESYNWYIAGEVNLTGLNTTVGAKAILHMIGSGVHDFWPPNMTYPREMYFEGSGSYTLRDNLSMLGFSPYTGLAHTNGIFNTNGFTINANSFSSYPLAPGLSRQLYMDNSVFNLNNFFLSSGLITNFSAVSSEVNLSSPTSELTIYDGYSAFPAPVTLASMVLPKVWFTSTIGTPRILYGSNIISITEMNVAPNLQQIYGGIRVGTLNLTGGTTVSLQSIRIATAVNVSGASCGDLVTLKSNTNGTQGSLFKPTGTFTIDRAYITDVTAAAGVPLTVTNGVDGGNNTNITIGTGTPRNFYWVGNSGNWNDGGHWSIGASGVPYPAVSTNPGGCIPTAIDNVFFDNASFSIAGQTVTITTDANCKNMDWMGSGAWTPTLAGTSSPIMNIYGSITLQNGMLWGHTGVIKMLGNNTAINSQTINLDGVTLRGSLWFQGGGRYDMTSNVTNLGLGGVPYNTGAFFIQAGKVYTNGFDIQTASMRLYLEVVANYFDATNSTITCQYVWNSHGTTNNYDFANSTFINSAGAIGIVITTPTIANYHNFILGGTSLTSNGTVTAQNVTRTAAVTTTTGNWVMDTLILAQSSSNTFQVGRTYTVNDTLIAFGTPCIPVILKADGGTATFESTSLNTLIQFGSLQNMTASLAPPGATAAGYQVIGADVGGNSNWTFSPAASLPYLGAYDVSANCDALPFGVSTAGFSPVPGTTYAWNTGSTLSTINLDTAGVYSVAVSYAPSCVVIDSIEFTIANTLDIQQVSVVMPSCFEDSTGTISTTIAGGNNDFDYAWTSPTGNPFTINPADSTQLSDLAAGSYQIIVNQTNNPVCADTLSFTITQPTLLSPDLTVTNLACNGDLDGEISATGTGGTPGYQVSIDGGSFNPAPFNFTGLNAGNYEIVVQDLNGCLDTITQTITQPTVLAASGSIASPLCNGDSNGSIGLTINGGTPTYQVSVNGGGFAPSASSYGGLTAGNYQLIVEDQNGCRDTINQVISEPAVLLASTAVTSNFNGSDVSCNGMTDGSISSSATGGTVNYNYSWNTSPVQTTQNLTGVGAGSYTVTITDQNGCTSQSSVTITEPVVLSDTYVVDQNANCNVADGAATITTLGGTPTYTYTWSNNPGNTTNSATDLVAGITNVTITDANGCVDNLAISINSINAPVPYLSADSVLCLGGSTGIALVDSVSGNGGYTFIWSDNLGNPIGQTNDTATGLPAGTYSVQVTDLNGCSAVQTVTVDEPVSSVAIAVVSVTSPACNTSDEGSITVSASGGTGTIDYSWNTTPAQTTPSITNLPEGTYIVTATDANGCSIDEVVQITAPTALALTAVQNDVSCFNGADGEISITAQGGTPTYTYSWTGSTSTTNQATTLGVGSYTALVSDANGCEDSLSFVVTEPTVLVAEILSSSSPDCGISNGTITIDVNGGTPNYSFLWNDGSTNQDNTMATSGVNSVVITDQNGCTQSLEIDLSCTLFEIPELLTPNNDGKNDLWAITGLENFPNTEVEIFNRWGTKVFGSDDYKNNWDGTSQSNLNIAGDQLPESSYFYVLTLGGLENDPNAGKVFKGYIYIKRN